MRPGVDQEGESNKYIPAPEPLILPIFLKRTVFHDFEAPATGLNLAVDETQSLATTRHSMTERLIRAVRNARSTVVSRD